MQSQGDLNVRFLVVIGVVSALLLIEIVVATQAYFYNTQEAEIIAKQVDQPAWELQEIANRQRAELETYRWVDREKRRVAIPIGEAITQYVELESQRAATRAAK